MHSYGFDGDLHVEIAVGALARYQKYTFRTTAGVTSQQLQSCCISLNQIELLHQRGYRGNSNYDLQQRR